MTKSSKRYRLLLAEARRRGLSLSGYELDLLTDLSLTYGEWYRRTVPPNYGFPRHVAFLCDLVQRVIDGEIPRLVISTPPGHAKSDTITRRVPLFWGPRHPKDAIVLTGYSQTFTERNLSKPTRELARELGILSSNATALDEWEFSGGGRLVARGVGSAPTGVNPISLLVCDDPIKDRAQAASETFRENLWQWWTGSIVQRFWPRTRAILIMTRWHEDDLVGRLRASNDGSWTFVNLPAIALADDPLGRVPGEALWPEEKPVEFLQKQRIAAGDYEFEALFQGNPTPREGSFFKVARLKIVDAVPEGLASCLSFDNAYSEDGGDWTAGPLMHGPDEDGLYYVEPWRIQKDPSERNRLMRQRAELKQPRYVTVPKDPAAGKEVAQNLIRMFSGFTVEAIPRRKGETKQTVADPFASQVNAGNVRVVRGPLDAYISGGAVRSYAADYIEELRAFPAGKHDDQVDGSADAFNKLAKPKRSWSF